MPRVSETTSRTRTVYGAQTRRVGRKRTVGHYLHGWNLARNGKKYLKLHMEPKRSPHSQDNPKQKEQSWRHHATWLQTILKRYSNQNSMVLIPKQRHRPMEQNRGLRSNATHLQPSDL
uniref:Uncharacterized protein n=1 Tax=Callithrix jacchus TaxID=9483 RepID=A0A8I3WRN8_CALJA